MPNLINIVDSSVLNYIRYKHFNLYGHVRRMNEEWLSQNKKTKKKLNGLRPKEEEKEGLKIRGCRK